MKNKTLLLIGYYGMGNFGDELMALNLAMRMEDKFKISVLSYASAPLWLEHRLVSPANIIPLSAKNVRRPDSLFRDLYRYVRAIASADLVVFGGGTFLFDTAVRPYRHLGFPLGTTILARLLRKKVAYLGIGLVPLQTALGRRMVRKALALANLITVRDEESLSLAQQLLESRLHTKVHHTADLGFLPDSGGSLPSVSAHVPNAEFPTVISFFGADYSKDAELSAELFDHASGIASALDRIVDTRPGTEVRFVAAQISNRRNDNRFNKMVISAMKHKASVHIVDLDRVGYDGAIDTIKTSGLVISMRLHPVVAALQLVVPVVAIGLKQKLRQLMLECGLSCYVVSRHDALEPARIASTIESALLAIDGDAYPNTAAAVESQQRRSLENISLLLKLCGYQ